MWKWAASGRQSPPARERQCLPRRGMSARRARRVWAAARCPAQSSLQEEPRPCASWKEMEGRWGAGAGAPAGLPSPPPPASSSPRQARASCRSSCSRSSPSRLGHSSRGASSWSGFGPKAQSAGAGGREAGKGPPRALSALCACTGLHRRPAHRWPSEPPAGHPHAPRARLRLGLGLTRQVVGEVLDEVPDNGIGHSHHQEGGQQQVQHVSGQADGVQWRWAVLLVQRRSLAPALSPLLVRQPRHGGRLDQERPGGDPCSGSIKGL